MKKALKLTALVLLGAFIGVAVTINTIFIFIDFDSVIKTYEIMGILKSIYYEDVTFDELSNNIYYGLFYNLDPYSCYFSEEDWDSFWEDTGEEEFGGIGVAYMRNRITEDFSVSEVYQGSPAEKAGVEIGDIITGVDGLSISGMEIEDVSDMVRGDVGTEVILSVFRGEDFIEIPIIRDKIDIENAYFKEIDENTAYIKIRSFMGDAGEAFSRCMDKADSYGNLILDLRGNSGGEVSVLKEVLNSIAPDGVALTFESKYFGDEVVEITAGNELKHAIVILQNGGSASCSECFIGMFKDNGWATLVGDTTYGKGVYQVMLPLEDGSGVKVTAGNYLTPNGTNINGVGIEPDIFAESDDCMDVAMEVFEGR